MALNVIACVLIAALVYLSSPLWGVKVPLSDVRWASVLTVAGGLALVLLNADEAVLLAFLLALLMVIAVVDWRERVIPNRLVLVGLAWAFMQRLLYGDWRTAVMVALGIFFFYLLIHVVSRGGLGMGDVKFSLVLALGLGYPAALVSMVTGTWAAGIYALVLWIRHRDRHAMMALGPFLAFGGVMGLLNLLH